MRLVLHPMATRRAGAVPVAVAAPFSNANTIPCAGWPIIWATLMAAPPGVPQVICALRVVPMARIDAPAARSTDSGVLTSSMVMNAGGEFVDPLAADPAGDQPSG